MYERRAAWVRWRRRWLGEPDFVHAGSGHYPYVLHSIRLLALYHHLKWPWNWRGSTCIWRFAFARTLRNSETMHKRYFVHRHRVRSWMARIHTSAGKKQTQTVPSIWSKRGLCGTDLTRCGPVRDLDTQEGGCWLFMFHELKVQHAILY